jgi:hypothetical protein
MAQCLAAESTLICCFCAALRNPSLIRLLFRNTIALAEGGIASNVPSTVEMVVPAGALERFAERYSGLTHAGTLNMQTVLPVGAAL